MTKFKMNRRSLMMGLSFFVFMMLGSFSASAQAWVSTTQAKVLLKGEIATLQNDYDQAQNDVQRTTIAFNLLYYNNVYFKIAEEGIEVATAVSSAKPTMKPLVHSTGYMSMTTGGANFKTEAQALVDAATDLLSN